MLNQLNKFIPHLADHTKPIRELLSSKTQWYWGPDQEKSFIALKEMVCSDECLALYDPNQVTVISADASAYGLGAVLRQKQANGNLKPVAYISRALTECEKRYAQIEKEALALTWACDRLSQYVLGSKFELETDHKPLVPLLSTKSLEELPVRIQRFRLRLMRYQYTINHVPGKEINTADFLSRAPLQNQENGELQDEIELFIDFITQNLPVTDKRLKQIKESQDNDPILSKWKEALQGGKRRDKSTNYNDLSIINGILMRGNRIVIPKGLQNEILDQLHSGHQGIFKCKERAHCSVWWPNITVDIEKYIKNCRICCQFQRPQIEPLCPSELQNTPWQKVGTDLFEWKSNNYLLVVDYYSRYIETVKLSSTTSLGVINHLKSIFARHGIPEIIVSDNGPQYASAQFDQFTQEYGIHHITSSPRYPQANGEAERAVKAVKIYLRNRKIRI